MYICVKSGYEIVFKRKIDKILEDWIGEPHHKPIVVKGIRQCGKTSSVMDFATRHFKHVVYLDFRMHPDYKKFFVPDISVSSIIMRISAAIPTAEIEPHETCFVFGKHSVTMVIVTFRTCITVVCASS